MPADYRNVKTCYYEDSFVEELPPDEKFFYLYLMTNSHTSQCGIYEITVKKMVKDTGYNEDTINKLIERFVGYGKILYNQATKEIMLMNWMKNNAIRSPKVAQCIKKELGKVKCLEYVDIFYTLCIRYQYPINSLCIDSGEEKEREEEINNNNKDKKISFAEYVSMTEKQYQALVEKHGETNTKAFIEILNNYKGAKGKKYKEDYLAILNWVVDKAKKDGAYSGYDGNNGTYRDVKKKFIYEGTGAADDTGLQ